MDNSTTSSAEIGSKEATRQAKAVLNAHKRKSPNVNGRNQFSDDKTLTPYSVKFALASAMLEEGRKIKDIASLSGLCVQTVIRIKKGERKISSAWVEAIKKNESAKHTFLSNTILDSINQNDIDKASLLQKVTSSSILIDKRRLLDGESTANISAHLSSLDSISKTISGLDSTLLKMASNQSDSVSSDMVTSSESDSLPNVSQSVEK